LPPLAGLGQPCVPSPCHAAVRHGLLAVLLFLGEHLLVDVADDPAGVDAEEQRRSGHRPQAQLGLRLGVGDAVVRRTVAGLDGVVVVERARPAIGLPVRYLGEARLDDIGGRRVVPDKLQLLQPIAGVAPTPLASATAAAAVVMAKPLTAADIKVKAAAAAASRRQGRCPSVDLRCGLGIAPRRRASR
jgi:hypothetical protein